MDNRRILIVDDNHDIHQDFWKALGEVTKPAGGEALGNLEDALFDDEPTTSDSSVKEPGVDELPYALSSVHQGQEAFELVKTLSEDQSFAMAFMDMRMPPGWDGLVTTQNLWTVDPRILVTICTAYTDYTWDQINTSLENQSLYVFLKKPYTIADVRRYAAALVTAWNLNHHLKNYFETSSKKIPQNQDTILSEILACVCRHTGWPCGHVWKIDPNHSSTLVSTDYWYLNKPGSFSSLQSASKDLKLNVGEDLPGEVLENKQSIWLEDIKNKEKMGRFQGSSMGVASGFSFPILYDDQVVAIFEFFSGDVQSKNDILLHLCNLLGPKWGPLAILDT